MKILKIFLTNTVNDYWLRIIINKCEFKIILCCMIYFKALNILDLLSLLKVLCLLYQLKI